jgi:hypothetical protein
MLERESSGSGGLIEGRRLVQARSRDELALCDAAPLGR